MHQHAPNKESLNLGTFDLQKSWFIFRYYSSACQCTSTSLEGVLILMSRQAPVSRSHCLCDIACHSVSPPCLTQSHQPIAPGALVLFWKWSQLQGLKRNSFHQLQMPPGRLSTLKQLWLIRHHISKYLYHKCPKYRKLISVLLLVYFTNMFSRYIISNINF